MGPEAKGSNPGGGGGHWGVLNTATPQKFDKNTVSPHEKLTKHRHRDIFSDFP